MKTWARQYCPRYCNVCVIEYASGDSVPDALSLSRGVSGVTTDTKKNYLTARQNHSTARNNSTTVKAHSAARNHSISLLSGCVGILSHVRSISVLVYFVPR
nr:hypothetical protein BaRGS_032192 [Batillaria attramentaria]